MLLIASKRLKSQERIERDSVYSPDDLQFQSLRPTGQTITNSPRGLQTNSLTSCHTEHAHAVTCGISWTVYLCLNQEINSQYFAVASSLTAGLTSAKQTMVNQYKTPPTNSTWLICTLTAEAGREKKGLWQSPVSTIFPLPGKLVPRCAGQVSSRKAGAGAVPVTRDATLHPWVRDALWPGQPYCGSHLWPHLVWMVSGSRKVSACLLIPIEPSWTSLLKCCQASKLGQSISSFYRTF